MYAVFALGYTLVFSILGIINFAHGAVFTLGAYLTYALAVGQFGLNGLLAGLKLPFALPFPLALLVGAVLSGLAGMAVERLAFRPLRARGADALLALVSSLGVALIIVNAVQYLFGAEIYAFPPDVLGSLPAAMLFTVGGKLGGRAHGAGALVCGEHAHAHLPGVVHPLHQGGQGPAGHGREP